MIYGATQPSSVASSAPSPAPSPPRHESWEELARRHEEHAQELEEERAQELAERDATIAAKDAIIAARDAALRPLNPRLVQAERWRHAALMDLLTWAAYGALAGFVAYVFLERRR